MSTDPAASRLGTTDVATHLMAIWTELLKVPQVAGSDNFVELGGDSIAATMCINRIRAELGVDIPVTTLLFEDATFESLVTEVNHAAPQPAP